MLLPSTVPAPSVTVPTNGGSGRKSKSSRTHRSRRRNAPSAASTVSSQLDRPYLYAFLTLLVIYMMVTLLTYEKLSRNHHPSPPSDQQELKQDSPPSQVVRTLEDHPLQPKSQNGSPGKTNGQAFSSSRPIRNVEEMQHHSFPLHVTKADMETIRHPGLELVNDPSQIPQNIPRSLVVPQFWGDVYASVYNASHSVREFLGNGTRIMTPQEASMIGSYAKVAATGEKDDESSMRETIYCSVASYRDYECTPTVQDIYERAKYPERIRVAVIDQSISGTDEPCLTPPTPCSQDPDQVLCKYRHLMDYYHLDAQLAVGPVFARHLAHRMYRGEYYAMQVDSHVRFTQDWDDDIIRQWKSANNEYAVLTAYLSDIHKRIDPVTHVGLSASRPIMCKSDYEGGGENRHLRHGQQPEGVPGIHGQPVLEPFWAAGYSFARGHFVLQVPYDQYLPMIFQGYVFYWMVYHYLSFGKVLTPENVSFWIVSFVISFGSMDIGVQGRNIHWTARVHIRIRLLYS